MPRGPLDLGSRAVQLNLGADQPNLGGPVVNTWGVTDMHDISTSFHFGLFSGRLAVSDSLLLSQ